MLHKLVKTIVGQTSQDRQADLYSNLIRHEAKIGAEVFGPVPAGHRREFFCLDRHTWVWHEEWRDETGQQRVRTTRYDVRPDGVLKSQNGHYQRVNDDELRRLSRAADMYVDRVSSEMYASVA
jgi:hypothetical protein